MTPTQRLLGRTLQMFGSRLRPRFGPTPSLPVTSNVAPGMCNEYISLVSFLSNILASIGTADGLALGAAAGLRKVEVELIIFLAIMLHKVGGKIGDVSLFVVVIAMIFSRPLQPLVSHLSLFSRCVNSTARLRCTFSCGCWPLCKSNIPCLSTGPRSLQCQETLAGVCSGGTCGSVSLLLRASQSETTHFIPTIMLFRWFEMVRSRRTTPNSDERALHTLFSL